MRKDRSVGSGRSGERAGAPAPERSRAIEGPGAKEGGRAVEGARAIGVGIAIAFGLQSLRALFPSMVYVLKDRFGMSSAELGGAGFALFALAAAGPVVVRRIGGWRASGAREFDGRRAVAATAIAMAAVRAALQLWRGDPVGTLVAAAAGTIVFFGLWAALVAGAMSGSRRRSPTILFLLGASIDTALHAAAGTRDLHWTHGATDLVTGALAAAVVACAWIDRRSPAAEPNSLPSPLSFSSTALFAIGPLLFLHLEWLANVARLSAKTGLGSQAAGAVVLGGVAIAMAATTASPLSRRSSFAAAVVLVLATAFSSNVGFAAIPIHLAAIVAAALLLRDAMSFFFPAARFPTLAAGGGAVLLLILVFAHYAGYDLPLPWTRTQVWVAAAVIFSIPIFSRRGILAFAPSPRLAVSFAAVPALLAIGLVAAAPRRPAPSAATRAVATSAPPSSILSFNLHAGFDERGGFDFNSMMDSVRAEHADVVALQEVSRGWLINGSADLFELARRSLAGDAAFGASVGGDWGNAVFSRAPITRIENVELPPRDLSLTRSVLAVEVGGALRVLATHYHHRASDDSIREIHSQFIVERFTGAETPSILLGDFNAAPGSPSLTTLEGGGWRDVASLPGAGPTYPSRAPERRIDTIFTRGLEATATRVLPAWGSDHRGVGADVVPLVPSH